MFSGVCVFLASAYAFVARTAHGDILAASGGEPTVSILRCSGLVLVVIYCDVMTCSCVSCNVLKLDVGMHLHEDMKYVVEHEMY